MAEHDDAFEPEMDRRAPATIEDVMGWGKHAGLTYVECARRDPGFLSWAAKKFTGRRAELCAMALGMVVVGEDAPEPAAAR